MKPNLESLNKVLNNEFDNNISAFARAIGVNRSQMSNILNKGIGAGSLFFGGLMAYCKATGKNYEDYIILQDPTKQAG